jgi:RNA polymerase sigma factor (sigma-70 family)
LSGFWLGRVFTGETKMTDSQQLLAEYAENGSEAAFRELVARYIDLVHSAAVRLVNGDTHLAEDVTQTVFADLARKARALSRDVMLGGWLHRHTCFIASKTLRSERRRLARERQAVEMNATEDHAAANLAQVAPVLDEAINQLGAEDRAAILLRFFEQNDFRSLGAALGSNEDAARKRVQRALVKLESLLKRRGVTLSVTALGTVLATQALTAAPAGLAASISTAALAGAATGGATSWTLLNIMSMTKLKVGVVSAIVIAGASVPWIAQHRTQNALRAANETLLQQSQQIAQLASENERLSNRLARATTPAPSANGPSPELLRLRGEVGRLRQQNAAEKSASKAKTDGPSALSGATSNPEMWKVIRDQQKGGMTMVYKAFAKRLELPAEQVDKLNDLHADHVMENLDRITEALRARKNGEEINQIFAEQEAALLEKARALLGEEGFAQYQEYNRNLTSHLTAEQFKGQFSGDKAVKEEKSKQLYQLMQDETQRTLANAGLPADFQTVPSLNFRNFASESEAEKNLMLLDGIYERVAAQSAAFLTPEEIAKFDEFRVKAINGNRLALTMNRKLMAPGSN